MIEQFLQRADARRCSLSQHELERRWEGLRKRMADAQSVIARWTAANEHAAQLLQEVQKNLP